MSTAQILEEIKSYPTTEFESLEHSIRLERLRRNRNTLSGEETRLFEIINQPMPRAERLRELEPAWEVRTLSEVERAELIGIVEAREELSAQRWRDTTTASGFGVVAREYVSVYLDRQVRQRASRRR